MHAIPTSLVPAIVESCRIKADVVSKDEREGGLRRILNFGHTVGHALEAVTRYRRFRHGEAIAYGMLAAADLARRAWRARANATAQALAQSRSRSSGPLPPIADLSTRELLEAVRRDKKVVNGRLHFVIAIAIGATTTVDDVTEDELREVLGDWGSRADALEGDERQDAASEDCVFLELLQQHLVADPQFCGRALALSPFASLQGLDELPSLDLGRRHAERVDHACPTGRSRPTESMAAAPRSERNRQVQMARLNRVVVAEDDGALDAVLQLAHVTRPRVGVAARRALPARAMSVFLFRSRQNRSTK